MDRRNEDREGHDLDEWLPLAHAITWFLIGFACAVVLALVLNGMAHL